MRNSLWSAIALFVSACLFACAARPQAPAAPLAAVGPSPTSRPSRTSPDYSSPNATARTMLAGVKANDVDAVMGCIVFSDPADATATRVVVQRDVALHRLVEAALARWGERAFSDGRTPGPGPAGLDPHFLAVSTSTIDRWLELIDQAHVTRLDEDHARLTGLGEPTIPRANWHGPLVEMTLGMSYVRTSGGWKADFTRRKHEPGLDQDDEQVASVIKDLAQSNQRVEQLARETETGTIKSLAELRAALASMD